MRCHYTRSRKSKWPEPVAKYQVQWTRIMMNIRLDSSVGIKTRIRTEVTWNRICTNAHNSGDYETCLKCSQDWSRLGFVSTCFRLCVSYASTTPRLRSPASIVARNVITLIMRLGTKYTINNYILNFSFYSCDLGKVKKLMSNVWETTRCPFPELSWFFGVNKCSRCFTKVDGMLRCASPWPSWPSGQFSRSLEGQDDFS